MTTAIDVSRQHLRRRPAITLVVVLLGMVTMSMSMSGTTVALPRIGTELNTSGTALQWVVTGYFLTFACFTLVVGSIADIVGRRRTYTAGVILLAGTFLVGALARDILLLDVVRTLAGLGAAGVLASGGAIIAATFEGAARTRAFAALGTMAGIGLAMGPTLSGALISALGWRATFWFFCAIFAVVAVGTVAITESRSPQRARIDWLSALLFISGLAMIMLAISQGSRTGWAVVTALIVGGLLLAVFVALQRRRAHPMLDLTLVGNRRFLGWCLAATTIVLGFAGVLVYLPTYLQGVNDASPRSAGLTMLMLTAPVLIVPLVGGWLVNRGLPAYRLITVALFLVAGGNAWLTVIHQGVQTLELLGPLLSIGIGMGLMGGITDGQAMSLVEPGRVGMAAGFLNTLRGGIQALVIAAFGSVLISLIEAGVGSGELASRVAAGDLSGGDRTFLAAQFSSAWHVVLWTIAGLCAAAGVTVFILLRPAARR